MLDAVSERSIGALLGSIYDSALDPAGWPVVLEELAGIFHSHFADLFTRSHDRSQYAGLSFGLDRSDYQDEFLDKWFKRNVWGLSKPVKVSGEVLSTRQMVAAEDLIHSEIYTDYLASRGLHEGLRLAIWVDDFGIQDISLLRPWSAGAFEAREIALGQMILPHLQRAAKVAHRLQYAEAASRGGLMALEAAGFAAILVDALGRPVLLNKPAEAIVRAKDGLAIKGSELVAMTAGANQALRKAVGLGLTADPLHRTASTIRLPRPSGEIPMVVVTVPLRSGTQWTMLDAPALLVLISDPQAAGPSKAQLSRLFGLTEAEADLAKQLLAGRDLREIATRRGRSVHTMRNHLARLMDKTETTRQAELVRLLRGVPAKPQLLGQSGSADDPIPERARVS